VRRGYKSTEVGPIPEDWKVVRVAEAGQVQGGRQRSPHAIGEPCRYLRVANVFDGFLKVDDVLEMPFSPAEKERFLLRDGDILLNEGQSIDLVGRSAIYRGTPGDCCFQNTLIRFRAGTIANTAFMHVLFQKCLYDGAFAAIALQTTSIAHLGSERFASMVIPLPPLNEQAAIAGALGTVSTLIEKLDRLITKKRDLKQAAMQQLLTGKRRLPGFRQASAGYKQSDAGAIPQDWEVFEIREIAGIKTGPFGSSLHERDYVPTGTPIITVEHLTEFGVSHEGVPKVSDADRERLKAYSLTDGDIVFSRVGSVDRNSLIGSSEEGWLFSGRLLRIRPSTSIVCAPYLSYHFHSEAFKQRVRSVAVGQTMASLNTKIIGAVKVAVPHLAEQAAIAAVLSDIDAEIAALERRRDKTRLLKQGMMQELLTGRIRLV
jgi:type I restriction enzyme, S subunit